MPFQNQVPGLQTVCSTYISKSWHFSRDTECSTSGNEGQGGHTKGKQLQPRFEIWNAHDLAFEIPYISSIKYWIAVTIKSLCRSGSKVLDSLVKEHVKARLSRRQLLPCRLSQLITSISPLLSVLQESTHLLLYQEADCWKLGFKYKFVKQQQWIISALADSECLFIWTSKPNIFLTPEQS